MAFIGRRAGVARARLQHAGAGHDLQRIGQLAVGGQLQAGVGLRAFLDEGVADVAAVRLGVLVRLRNAEHGRAQGQRFDRHVLHAHFQLPRLHGRQEGVGVAGPERRFLAQRNAAHVAGIGIELVGGLPHHRSLRQEARQAAVPLRGATLVVGALIEAHEAATGQPLPVIAEAHPVQREERGLAAVQATCGRSRHLRRRREYRHRCFVDVAGADVLVDARALVHGAAEVVGTDGQLMADAAGLEAATQLGTGLLVATGVVRAAVVVDVIVAVGREVVARHAAIGALHGVVAAVGEGDVVIDHRTAVADRDARLPGLVEVVGMQRGDVGAGDIHRALPRLVTQQVFAVDATRQVACAQQLVAGHRTLRAGLVVGIHFQLAALANEPVSGQRVEVAAAIGVLDIGVAGIPCGIQAQAETRGDPVADIDGDVARAFRIGTERGGAHFGRALADVVDDAARRHHACGQAGFTLEDLHRLHVLQRQALFAGDGQAVEAVAGGGVQGEATDGDVLVVTHRRIRITQRGIVAGQLGQRTHLATVQVIALKHVHRGRRVLPAAATEGVHA